MQPTRKGRHKVKIRNTPEHRNFVNDLMNHGASYDQADGLFFRLRRYALANARQWERANNSERYANSPQCERDEQALDKRRENLQAEISAYGLRMVNYGLYPTIERAEDGRTSTLAIFVWGE